MRDRRTSSSASRVIRRYLVPHRRTRPAPLSRSAWTRPLSDKNHECEHDRERESEKVKFAKTAQGTKASKNASKKASKKGNSKENKKGKGKENKSKRAVGQPVRGRRGRGLRPARAATAVARCSPACARVSPRSSSYRSRPGPSTGPRRAQQVSRAGTHGSADDLFAIDDLLRDITFTNDGSPASDRYRSRARASAASSSRHRLRDSGAA
jgi:hypothetical protein